MSGVSLDSKRFLNTPGLFLFRVLPREWDLERVQLWSDVVGLTFLHVRLTKLHITGSELIQMNMEERLLFESNLR